VTWTSGFGATCVHADAAEAGGAAGARPTVSGLGFLLVAGLLAVNFGFAVGNGVDGSALEAAVFAAGLPATVFFGDFFAAVTTFAATACFSRVTGAAVFAAGFTTEAALPAALVLRFFALAVFFAVAVVPVGLSRLCFAFPGFDFAAFAEDAAFDFCRAGFLAFAVFRAPFLASFTASLAAFLSALLAFFSAFRAALAATFSVFFARLSSAFDFLAMFRSR
jgi:hypothetical protein